MALRQAAPFCRLCYHYTSRIVDGKENKHHLELYELRDRAHLLARASICSSDAGAIFTCDECKYSAPKLHELFRERAPDYTDYMDERNQAITSERKLPDPLKKLSDSVGDSSQAKLSPESGSN